MRTTIFSEGEIYHIYNRGVDKRIIYSDKEDLERFLKSMREFNSIDPIGSIYEHSFVVEKTKNSRSKNYPKPLVKFIAYCINPNHYHFILEQVAERGIEKFMHRIGTGYTKYFNTKHKRLGSLFQGKFKSSHVDSNKYLLHLSAYVNLNDQAHQLGSRASKLVQSRSSWNEYMGKEMEGSVCSCDIILGQFKNRDEYKKFAKNSIRDVVNRKGQLKEIEDLIQMR